MRASSLSSTAGAAPPPATNTCSIRRWSARGRPAPIDKDFVQRIEDYAIKAAREGKLETSWLNPNEDYEQGLRGFVRAILDRSRAGPFLDSFESFARRTALLGALNSLTQLVLKATMPGVPDFYQGTETWDLSLVDPDNRRPVDFDGGDSIATRHRTRVSFRMWSIRNFLLGLRSCWISRQVRQCSILCSVTIIRESIQLRPATVINTLENTRPCVRLAAMSNVSSDTPRSFRRKAVMNSIKVDAIVKAPRVAVDLRAEEHAFELPARLFEQLPFAVYVCDRDGLVLRYNRRAAELWGRSPKLGDPNERFCGSYRMYRPDGSLLPHHQCPMADVLRTGISVRQQEVHIERPDGLRGIALVDIEAIKDSGGNIVGAVNCFQDITERKQAEEYAKHTRARGGPPREEFAGARAGHRASHAS